MSAINQMLRDLDKRKALALGAAPLPAPANETGAPNRLASAYASVRLMGPRTPSRHLLLAAGVAALLPIAWATNHFDLPAMAVQAAPAPVAAAGPAAGPAAAPVLVATAPMAGEGTAGAATNSAAVAAPNPASTGMQRAASTFAPMPAAEPAPTTSDRRQTAAAPPTAATTVVAASPAASRAANLPLARSLPTTVTDAPTPLPGPSAPLAMQAGSKPRLVRAPVMEALKGEDDVVAPAVASAPAPAPAPALRQATPPAPRDTRLALASPTVPKDEARIERRPTDARDDLVRAGEAMSIGRTSDAIALLRKVIQAEPDNERARLALLSLLAERGRDETWRVTLADSAKALPKRFGLAAAQGMAESGRFEESLAILRSLPESVRDTRYFSALGATHQQLNQHADAVAAFDAALGTAAGGSPQLPSLLVAQALSMQSLGKTTEARSNLERVRQMPEAAADVRDYAVRELAHSR